MKQIKINEAYKNMEQLVDNKELTPAEQWKLYKLRKALKPHIDFYEEQYGKIGEKYTEVADQNGMVHGEHAVAFAKDVNDLNNLDVETEEFERPAIRFVEGINFMTAEALEDFIEFIPPEGV